MKKSMCKWGLFLFLLIGVCGCKQHPSSLSLAGEWSFALDPEDVGLTENWQNRDFEEAIILPGSLQEQGYGYDIDIDTKWTGQVVDSSWYTSDVYKKYREAGNVKVPFWLNPDKHYVGVAWYQKEIEVPAAWNNQPIELGLERTHWTTTLYLDGEKMGTQSSLHTPHRYLLDSLSVGKHRVTLRVDNRMYVDVGKNAHSMSDHTQSNWNGIIGEMTLTPKPALRVENVQIYPDIREKEILVKIDLEGCSDGVEKLYLQAKDLNGKQVGESKTIELDTNNPIETRLALGEDAQLWSEHTPQVYQLEVVLQDGKANDSKTINFGLREFKANGTRFEINGSPLFLRGTLECCIFPLTGYPAMDTEYWSKIYNQCKAYGLNHVRFHSWCPPEVAFHVADSLGIYLQVECGTWTEVGSGLPQDEWIYGEADRILKAYGNHPSFCLMVHGNEPAGAGQTAYLTDLIASWKAQDNRRVYSSSGGWPYLENADYWNAPDPRIQAWGEGVHSIINKEKPRSDYDFKTRIRTDMPTVSHEIGQWCVYPNLKEKEKYTGVLKAKNFEIFEETLAENGMSDLADDFLYASGRLQTLCYKADIEAALRTPGFAGFQLLDLHDFPGQGTALVGVLDPFWEEKGYVDGAEYSQFCNKTVPLIRFSKKVFLNNETLQAPFEFAHFDAADLKDATVKWTISKPDGTLLKESVQSITIPIGNGISQGEIVCDLSEVKEPARLVVSLGVEHTAIRNQWNVWVYPAEKKKVDMPYITHQLDREATERLKAGESVLWLTYNQVPADKGGDIAVGFSSIFWNTAWTGKQAPHTLGIYCDANHPALAAFPNEGVSDYQWWDIAGRSQAMVMNDLPSGFRPVVHLVDDWFTNRKLGILYEAQVENGKLMVCSVDLENELNERPAAAQFKQSILEYMASDQFNPEQRLDIKAIRY